MNIRTDLIDLPEKDLRASIDDDSLDELVNSIREHGQLQAIGVRPKDDERFEVIFGARRLRAVRLLGEPEIRAELVPDNTDTSTAAKKLIENVQREQLTPIEEAYGLAELIGEGEADVRQLQRQTGKSRDWIKTRLMLLGLPNDVQGAVQAGLLSIGVAQALGSIDDDGVRELYLKNAVEYGCTTEQAQAWAASAEFAKQGMMPMSNDPEKNNDLLQQPQVVDQQYHCFVCATLHNWREVNTLVVCGGCQQTIAETRRVRAQQTLSGGS